jgi:D-xylose transport system ATP-binding protein
VTVSVDDKKGATVSHATNEVILELRGVSKFFGPVTALSDIDLTLHRGEVLALLGDNGAGKSTLVRILSGLHKPDVGELLLDGVPTSFARPAEARQAGIETVYQDLALFDNLTAAENFFVGREPSGPTWLGALGWVNKREMKRRTAERLRDMTVGIKDPSMPVGLMSGGQRQAIAVARAEQFASKIIILDEPTAALGVRETRSVVDIIKSLPAKGVSVILITHNMQQAIELADRAVVLRQGHKVGEVAATAANEQEIVSMIVGATAAPRTN